MVMRSLKRMVEYSGGVGIGVCYNADVGMVCCYFADHSVKGIGFLLSIP